MTRTPAGTPAGSQPLPTTTMSVSTRSWRCSDSTAARSASGARPADVSTMQPNAGVIAAAPS